METLTQVVLDGSGKAHLAPQRVLGITPSELDAANNGYRDDLLEFTDVFYKHTITGEVYTSNGKRLELAADDGMYSNDVLTVNGMVGDVVITKTTIFLDSVDNTADLDKPLSNDTVSALAGKQATLVSGSNIKTVAGFSLVGTGDVPISLATVWVVRSANYTAVPDDAILANTTGGPFVITLPATPSNNATVCWKDYAGTFGTNKITFGRNGNNIMGLPEDMDVSQPNLNGMLTFIAATNDWRY